MSYLCPINIVDDKCRMSKYYFDEKPPLLNLEATFETSYAENGEVSVYYYYPNMIMYAMAFDGRLALVFDRESGDIESGRVSVLPQNRHVVMLACTVPDGLEIYPGSKFYPNVHAILQFNSLMKDCKIDFYEPKHEFLGIKHFQEIPLMHSMQKYVNEWLFGRPETNKDGFMNLVPISRKIADLFEDVAEESISEICDILNRDSSLGSEAECEEVHSKYFPVSASKAPSPPMTPSRYAYANSYDAEIMAYEFGDAMI